MRIRKLARNNSGQALVETALILPLLLIIVLNAVNFAYLFLMALNITASSRSSTIYSVMGGSTPASIAYPQPGPPTFDGGQATGATVSDLAFQDLYGGVYSPSTTNAGVQVCSSSVGILNGGNTNMKTSCTNYGIGSFPSSQPDPEMNAGKTAPAFLLNRVDVAYQFSPPIPSVPFFNIIVLATPVCNIGSGGKVTCTFYRHALMREM
jgi:hypothetical protein